MIRRDASPRFPRLESLAVSGRIAFLRNLSPGIDTTSITRLEIIFTEPLAYTWASDLALFSRLRHLGIIDRRKYRVQGICLPTDATFDHLESLHFSTTAPTDIIWNVPPLRVLRVGIDLNDWLIKVPDVQAEHVAVEFTWDFLNGMEKKLSEISVIRHVLTQYLPYMRTLAIPYAQRAVWDAVISEGGGEYGSTLPVISFE